MRGHSSHPPKAFVRIEHETGFTAILTRMLAATPGAIGAALVDAEGEAVDYSGPTIDPFELKVAAAHFRIVLQELERGKLTESGGLPRRLSILTSKRMFVIDCLPDGYALLSVLHRTAAFGHADRALDAALHDLYREAGWNAAPGVLRWQELQVKCDPAGRPTSIRIDVGWRPVKVIGKVAAGLQRGETGFRVGVGDVEVTLVRGLDDRWYGDLPSSEFESKEGKA
jgi:hypothetical protein